MKPGRIAELRELCEKATPGPWRWSFVIGPSGHRTPRLANSALLQGQGLRGIFRAYPAPGDADAALVAAARTALPEALDEIERLQGRVDRESETIAIALKAGSDLVKQMRAQSRYIETHDGRKQRLYLVISSGCSNQLQRFD